MSTTTDFATQLLVTLQTADDNYIANVLMALDHGLPLFKARKDAEKTVEKEAEKEKEKEKPAVKAKKAVKKEKAVDVDLPAADNGAPDASEYRIDQDSIDTSTCVGRQVMDMDKRWSTAIIRERQCGKEIAEDGLCKVCAGRAEKYEEKPGSWLGRVTEEPFDWCHMLGTAWAEKKKPVFNPSASAPVSENGSDQEEMEVKEKKKPGRAPKMTEAEKEAAAEAKKAEKEAAKAAKEAEKAAAAEAKKAEKAAEKAKKEAEKEAKKAEKAPKAKKEAPKAKKAEAKVVSTEEPVEVLSNLRYIDDVLYWVRDDNVYNYTELTEEVGNFVGRLTDQGTIDTEADEVKAEESE
jgi:chemotaxis protein histidine kinase CheA